MTIRKMMTAAVMCLLMSVTLIMGVSLATGRNVLLSLVHAADEDPDPKPDNTNPDLKDILFHFFDKVKENPFTFGEDVHDPNLKPDDFRKIHLEWLEEDPANLAAAANYLDHELSLDDNRILYRQSGELVGAQCDLAIEDMLNDPAYRKEILDRVEEILKDAKVEVKDIQNYGSWMYQRDLNEDGVPEVIIRSDPQNYVRSKGHELVYTITVDGKEYTLHFRLECGFQPIMISWWTPPVTPPPPPSTTPHTTATTATTKTTRTTTETTHGPYKNTDQVVTNDEGGNHNGYVDERPTTTIASGDKYIPGKATSSSQPASTTASSRSTPASSSQPASSGTTGASNVEDKILPSMTVTVRPEAVTTPADDYVAPKEPALTSVAPVDQRIDIPE